MFLAELSMEEKKSFLSLADILIRADGKILQSEKSFVKQLKYEMGITNVEILPTDTIENACQNFKTKRTKVSAILDLIAIGYADTQYCIEEAEIVKNISDEFKIEFEEFLELESLALKILSLKDEAQTYMEEKI
ncbi:hypothetical protein KAJ27_24665 [bacterium]|nr:hypothetical protein [bacterium]